MLKSNAVYYTNITPDGVKKYSKQEWLKLHRDAYAFDIHSDIVAKLDDICSRYQDYPSYQHAAWIIEEEYREFCAELFKKDSEWDYTKIYKELIDIMAACYRTIIDRDLLSHIDNEEVK